MIHESSGHDDDGGNRIYSRRLARHMAEVTVVVASLTVHPAGYGCNICANHLSDSGSGSPLAFLMFNLKQANSQRLGSQPVTPLSVGIKASFLLIWRSPPPVTSPPWCRPLTSTCRVTSVVTICHWQGLIDCVSSPLQISWYLKLIECNRREMGWCNDKWASLCDHLGSETLSPLEQLLLFPNSP